MVVVCGKICGKISGKKCVVKFVVKLNKLLDWNKNWCGSRYLHPNYDSGLW